MDASAIDAAGRECAPAFPPASGGAACAPAECAMPAAAERFECAPLSHADGGNAVVLPTRAPEPGRTKTRMMPDLPPEQCAELHVCLLQDAARLCAELSRESDVFVAYAPEGPADKVRAAFSCLATYFPQCGDDLGARLRPAAYEVLDRGYGRCVLLGADAPETRADDVLQALSLLDEADVVFGPAADGGFYLAAFSTLHQEALGLSAYGHERVLEQTCDAVRAAGLHAAFVPERSDVDCWHDALGLIARSHADSGLPPDVLGEIRRVMRTHCVGCFGVVFEPAGLLMRICGALSNFRCYVRRIMFGDQGIFIERELFCEVGGFPDLPLMEDYQFSLTLRARGFRPGATRGRLRTSPRRYGATWVSKLRTMRHMARLRARYRAGDAIEDIARAYADVR